VNHQTARRHHHGTDRRITSDRTFDLQPGSRFGINWMLFGNGACLHLPARNVLETRGRASAEHEKNRAAALPRVWSNSFLLSLVS
jgi:hypothetical protein